MSRITIVVPCYNEAKRLDIAAFERALTQFADLAFLFVDDGSSDGTVERLRGFKEKNTDRVRVLELDRNHGKAQAVRAGMLDALEGQSQYCGYWDADLATPLGEIARFIEVLDANPALDLVIGSRVKLLGRSIERNSSRHYLGRVAATIASLVLDLPVYDTQCGAKIFRNSPGMRSLFAEPLLSGWVFDVELIARLIRYRRQAALPSAEFAIYEIPLLQWHDIAGSKIRAVDYARALIDVIRVWRRILRD